MDAVPASLAYAPGLVVGIIVAARLQNNRRRDTNIIRILAVPMLSSYLSLSKHCAQCIGVESTRLTLIVVTTVLLSTVGKPLSNGGGGGVGGVGGDEGLFHNH